MKLECTFEGERAGFASILLGEIGILSLGHQILPSSNLGLFAFERGFTRRSKENGPLRTWVQVISEDLENQTEDLWSEIAFFEENKEIVLELRNENFGEKKHVMIVFFLKGEEFYLGQERKTFQLFEQYDGEAIPVSFGRERKKIEIIPEFDASMHIIPLAGGEHYFGANYLLGYELPEFGKLYRFHFYKK